MATINGTPSVFITPKPPPEILPTYPVRVISFAEIASEMATESEVDLDVAEAEWLADPEAQREYQEWCEALDEQWRNDPVAQAEFDEWCNEQERIEREVSELETAEHEAYEAHLEAQAEEAELARLGEGYLIGANTNDDEIWQAGGSV